MLKRFTAFFVSFCLILGFVCSSVVSFAVAPLVLAQAALASYVTSAGYKMWAESGGGELMVEALSALYQSWLDSTDPVGALTLGQMSEHDYVYLDNSGQIVIRKSAADLFQQFVEWIQTSYSVPVGSDTPTTVVRPSSGGGSVNSGSVSGFSYPFHFAESSRVTGNFSSAVKFIFITSSNVRCSAFLTSDGGNSSIVFASSSPFSYGLSQGTNPSDPNLSYNASSTTVNGKVFYRTDLSATLISTSLPSNTKTYPAFPASSINTICYEMLFGDVSISQGIIGLGVTLGQAVVDVVGQAMDDDAVVIGVGASAGATAQDVADMVAQGIQAQTLDPSVSITAEAVIDTPVQPYPDVDSLGLPQLGLALTTRFPFSIPWDISAIYSALSAPSEPPVKTFDLIPASVLARWGINANTSITIDLTDQKYDVLLAVIHWSCIIGFCFGLAVMTKRYVWTTGG